MGLETPSFPKLTMKLSITCFENDLPFFFYKVTISTIIFILFCVTKAIPKVMNKNQ